LHLRRKGCIPGQHASIRTSESQPVFYFYFEDKAAGLGKFGTGTVSNPNQFALVKLDVTKSSRETTIGEFGASGLNTWAAEKSMVTFRSERLRSGLYKVVSNGPMEPGEYCFLAPQGSQIFDFAATRTGGAGLGDTRRPRPAWWCSQKVDWCPRRPWALARQSREVAGILQSPILSRPHPGTRKPVGEPRAGCGTTQGRSAGSGPKGVQTRKSDRSRESAGPSAAATTTE